MQRDDAHAHTHAAGHFHFHVAEADSRRLTMALGLILAFMVFEVVMAVVGRSLALLADAGHMLTDATALGASILATNLARRPPRGSWTFGLRRAEILSAQGNGITLLVVSAVVAVEAVRRLLQPPAVHGGIVLAVAGVGVAVNLLAVRVLRGGGRRSLNVEGSFRHILTDLYAFIATLAAGAVILLTGFTRADAIASLVVVALMLVAAWSLLKAAGLVLLEAAPAEVDVGAVGQALASHANVAEIHDLHVWTITSGFLALAAHVLVDRDADCHAIRRDLEALLHQRFDIEHTTLQVDHVSEHVTTARELMASAPAPRRRVKS